MYWPTHPQSSGREFRHVFHVTIEEKLPNAN